MSKVKISDYDKLTFEECVRILYYAFSNSAGVLKAQIAELLVMPKDQYHQMIAPIWYDGYISEVNGNKEDS